MKKRHGAEATRQNGGEQAANDVSPVVAAEPVLA